MALGIKNKENLDNASAVQLKNKEDEMEHSSSSPLEISISESKTLTNPKMIGKAVLASPSVRRFARELGCNLSQVKGTGRKGRITQDDVQEYIKSCLSDSEQPADSGY